MYPENKTEIDLSPERVHSIVLWSKDFSNVLKNPGHLEEYNLYFQYTITNYSKFLEPHTPEYEDTLRVLDGLLKRYKPEQFNIRFDPIIISTKGEKEPTPEKPGKARLKAFEKLCKDLNVLGMNDCRITTSYISMYGHVGESIKKSGLDIIDLNEDLQCKFLERMVEIADKYNMTIYICSNPILEKVDKVKKSACIDGDLLTSLFGGKVSKSKDTGQRTSCGCSKSKDIGNYNQKCAFQCVYCYARK